ncbi:MAG: deoxyribodipyrimidine photo-lyase, partial [Chloroflexota bacterium]
MRPHNWTDWLSSERMVALNDQQILQSGSAVVYWSQNAHRGVDNEALNAAIALGDELGVGVVVYASIHSDVPHSTMRSHSFLLEGLRDMAGTLRYRGIPLVARLESSEEGVVRFADELRAAAVVTDRSALRLGRNLRKRVAQRLEIACLEVDSEHIVPLHLLGRAFCNARSLRSVLSQNLDRWLWPRHDPAPRMCHDGADGVDFARPIGRILDELEVDRSVAHVRGMVGGTCEAVRRFGFFLTGVPLAHECPWNAGHSRLSPYIRFGHISPSAVVRALRITPSDFGQRALDEVLTRRELAANFTWYTDSYSSISSIPGWAQSSLQRHAGERAGASYSRAELADGETDDLLWNASQRELRQTGRIQSYVRMYWGKR